MVALRLAPTAAVRLARSAREQPVMLFSLVKWATEQEVFFSALWQQPTTALHP